MFSCLYHPNGLHCVLSVLMIQIDRLIGLFSTLVNQPWFKIYYNVRCIDRNGRHDYDAMTFKPHAFKIKIISRIYSDPSCMQYQYWRFITTFLQTCKQLKYMFVCKYSSCIKSRTCVFNNDICRVMLIVLPTTSSDEQMKKLVEESPGVS